jgi:hypothetical protein
LLLALLLHNTDIPKLLHGCLHSRTLDCGYSDRLQKTVAQKVNGNKRHSERTSGYEKRSLFQCCEVSIEKTRKYQKQASGRIPQDMERSHFGERAFPWMRVFGQMVNWTFTIYKSESSMYMCNALRQKNFF